MTQTYENAFKQCAGWKFEDSDTTGLLQIPFVRNGQMISDMSLGQVLKQWDDKMSIFTSVYKVPHIYLSAVSKLMTYELIMSYGELKNQPLPLYISPQRWDCILMTLLEADKEVTYQNFLIEFKRNYINYFGGMTDITAFKELTINSKVLFIFSNPEKYVKVANHQCFFNKLFKEINDTNVSGAILLLDKSANSKLMKKEKTWHIDLEPTLDQVAYYLTHLDTITEEEFDNFFTRCLDLAGTAMRLASERTGGLFSEKVMKLAAQIDDDWAEKFANNIDDDNRQINLELKTLYTTGTNNGN